jgi:hypothetical protein
VDVPGKESGGGAHRGGGATTGWKGGSVRRWGPHRREGRRQLRLAPGAVGEDERGEGGSKSGNGGGLAGLTGGDGDGSGRKRAEDHCGSGVVAASPATRRVGKVRRAQTKKKGTAKWGNGTAACGF